MTTGTLKLASLLIVIAAGGGVAWQAQQGILHPAKTAPETVVDSETDDADEDKDSTSAADLANELLTAASSKDRPSRSTARWGEDEESESPQRTATPEKYQRSTTKAKSAGSPIPARKSTPTRIDDSAESSSALTENSDEDSTEVADPFAVKPASKSPRRRALTPVPEADSSNDAEDDDERPTLMSIDAEETDATPSDSSEDAGPVLLVGNEELLAPDDVKATARRKSPKRSLKEMPTVDDPLESAEDPFAGAAPPELDSDAAPEKKTNSPELPAISDDEDDGETVSLRELLNPAKSSRQRRKPADPQPADDDDPFGADPSVEMPADLDLPKSKSAKPLDDEEEKEAEAVPSRIKLPTEADEFSGSDPNADDSLPSLSKTATPEKGRRDEPISDEFDTDVSPSRSRRSSRRNDDEAEEKSPQLLPVPDVADDESDPGLSPDRPPALTIDDDELETKRPRKGVKPDDLNGDAVPDHNAPKGMQQPRLTIEKIAPKQAVLGQELIYSVVVKNAGSADAHHVTVEDRIPKGTKLIGTVPRAELIDKRLVWKLGMLRPDEQKKISIKLIPQEQGPIGSVAKVNFVAEIAAEIEITAPQVVLSIDSPSQVRLGDKLQMIFKVRNAGRADAENIVVRNLIPEGLRHPAGADLEYAIGTLPAQADREIKLDLIATKNGKVHNKTIITGDHGIKLEEETPIEVIGEQLLLTRTGKSKLYVDKAALFTSTIANEGTAAAAKVMVAEIVPTGLEFVNASDGGKFDPTTRAVTWSIGPIAPGEEQKLSTNLMPKVLGDYRATVTVTGPAGSVATVDAELKVDGFPGLGVDSKSNTRLISVGEKATIRAQCKNQGTAAVKNLILSAELPPELKLVDGKGQTAWAQQGNVITFEAIGALNPGDTAVYDIQVEGLTEGDTVIELMISADHLKRPLKQDETIRVAPESE